jgi:hypothetical protein
MKTLISGGRSSYGHLVGILMSDSMIPRIPGDPGHAETFAFPVVYEVLRGFSFADLVAMKKDNLDPLLEPAIRLQEKGVSLIATDCGLFGPYHHEFNGVLEVPFIGTALDLVPLLQRLHPSRRPIGIITGDCGLLQPAHLLASGIKPETVVLAGMENSAEFKRVVIDRARNLNVEAMRQDVIACATTLVGKNLGAVVLECTNLISYKIDIQKVLGIPVFDLASLIEFYISGLRLRTYHSQFI